MLVSTCFTYGPLLEVGTHYNSCPSTPFFVLNSIRYKFLSYRKHTRLCSKLDEMGAIDRTRDWNQVVDDVRQRLGVPVRAPSAQYRRSMFGIGTPNSRSKFTTEASDMHKVMRETKEKLKKLTKCMYTSCS